MLKIQFHPSSEEVSALQKKNVSGRVTMKEVARRAGVSPSTVCRALSSNPQIPNETRDKVRRAAEQLGYRPDPLLSAFASRKRGKAGGAEVTTIGYITNFAGRTLWMENPFYRRSFEGAMLRANEFGYKLEHFWLGEKSMTGERLSRILYNRGILGFCVAPTPHVRESLRLDWNKFCCVTMGYSLQNPNLHRTTPHHFHAILETVRQLSALGYRRMGLCLYADTSKRVDELWLAGALLAREKLSMQGVVPKAELKTFLFNDVTLEDVPAWCRREGLEVVISDNTTVMQQMIKEGISVPGDVDFATLNWVDDEPHIAGIDQRPELIGAAAMDIVISQIQRGERGIPLVPLTTMVEGKWVKGESLSKFGRS